MNKSTTIASLRQAHPISFSLPNKNRVTGLKVAFALFLLFGAFGAICVLGNHFSISQMTFLPMKSSIIFTAVGGGGAIIALIGIGIEKREKTLPALQVVEEAVKENKPLIFGNSRNHYRLHNALLEEMDRTPQSQKQRKLAQWKKLKLGEDARSLDVSLLEARSKGPLRIRVEDLSLSKDFEKDWAMLDQAQMDSFGSSIDSSFKDSVKEGTVKYFVARELATGKILGGLLIREERSKVTSPQVVIAIANLARCASAAKLDVLEKLASHLIQNRAQIYPKCQFVECHVLVTNPMQAKYAALGFKYAVDEQGEKLVGKNVNGEPYYVMRLDRNYFSSR